MAVMDIWWTSTLDCLPMNKLWPSRGLVKWQKEREVPIACHLDVPSLAQVESSATPASPQEGTERCHPLQPSRKAQDKACIAYNKSSDNSHHKDRHVCACYVASGRCICYHSEQFCLRKGAGALTNGAGGSKTDHPLGYTRDWI